MTTATGHSGTVHFDGQLVTIAREGRLAKLAMGSGDKRIPLRSISAVQLKPAGALTNGFIAFTISGGHERNERRGGRTMAAASDENSVIFTKKQEPEFVALRAEIEAAMVAPAGVAAPDLADQLAKLAALRDQGVLTDAEFAAKKAELLSRM